MEGEEGFGGSDLFGFGGKKKYEANVVVLLRDLDHDGHISPYAASSKTANEFRLTGCSEHETALGLCLTQAIALFKTGKMIEAISLISSAEEKARVWLEARVVRVELAQDFFRDVENATGYGRDARR